MTTYSAILTNLICTLPVAGLLLAEPTAPAQTSPAATATIPFAFSVNGANMPAGRYALKMVSENMVSVLNLTTRTTQLWMVRPEYGREPQSRGRLIFERNGGSSYLTQVWLAGSTNHSEMIGRPKHEREVVAKNASSTISSFEIALK